jgi:hypothetical protein
MSNNAYYEENYNGYSAYSFDEQYSPETVLSTLKNEINNPVKYEASYGHIVTDTEKDLSVEDGQHDFPLSSSTGDSGSSPTKKAKRNRPRSHTPRPSNSFILYRREKHLEIMQQNKGAKSPNNNVISKIVADMWRKETPEIKAHFAALADAEKRAHMLIYPDYKYRPRKAAAKKTGGVRKASLPQREVKLLPVAEHYGNGSMATYSMMNEQQMHYMVPSMGMGYAPVYSMNQIPRMSMLEHEQESYDQFVMSPSYEQDFIHQDALLTPAEYTHAWPLQQVNQVWDLGMEKPFESINE